MSLTIKSTLKLNNGVLIPVLGFGTYQIKGDAAYPAVLSALRAGYRHIDTAAVYNNEEAVGRAIRDSGIPRSEIFVTSKLGPKDHGYESALQQCDFSLKRLGLDYLDLYLIHWPAVTGIPKEEKSHIEKRRETWRAFEKLYRDGKCRAIGVSNYLVHHLEDLISNATVIPAVNQVEYHPRLQYKDLRAFCDEKGIFLEAYSSIGQGKLLTNEVAMDIANKKGKSVAQVLLRWGLQKGTVILPKSDKEHRIIENSQLFDWELTPEEMSRLDALDENYHYCWDPNGIP